MKQIFIAITAAMLLTGCFPGSTLAIKENPSATSIFRVNEGYQSVYRKIVPQMRACWETAFFSDKTVVRSDLYTDIRKAELAVEGMNALGRKRVMMLVEIDAISDTETEVRAYQPVGTTAVTAVRKWIFDGYTECQYKGPA